MGSGAQTSSFNAIRAFVLKPILRRFGTEQSKLRQLLHASGLDLPGLKDDYSQIPLTLYLKLFEQAATVLNEPLLGAKLGIEMQPADLGPIGLRVMQAESVRSGIEVMARYANVVQSGTRVALERASSEYHVTYTLLPVQGPGFRQDAEFTLAGICGLIRSAFDPRWRPVSVHFRHDDGSNGALLEQMLKAPVHFSDGANRIVITATDAERVHRSENEALVTLIERHMMDMIGDGKEAVSLADQVRALITIYLGRRTVDLQSIAAGMQMSPRSLQRRLAGDGVQLSQLVQEHRKERAETLLRQKGATVESVSMALGYNDATAFWRAYRRWTGRNPSQDLG